MRRVFYHLLLLCSITTLALGQKPAPANAWIPAGDGLMYQPLMAAVAGDTIYVLHDADSEPTRLDSNMMAVSRWDGTSWKRLTTFLYLWKPYSFTLYKGDLYLGGYSPAVNGIAGTGGVARWNGSAWETVGGGIIPVPLGSRSSGVLAMTEFNGKLIAGGDFSSIGGVRAPGLAQWDGSGWSALESPSSAGIRALGVRNGRLYATLLGSPGVFEWNGNAWANILPDTNLRNMNFGTYKGKLALIGNRALIRQGNEWRAITEKASWRSYPLSSIIEHGERLFITGIGGLSEGADGDMAHQWDGKEWTAAVPGGSSINFLVESGGRLYAGGSFKLPGTDLWYHGVMWLCDESCAEISGTVYHDMNGDCGKSSGEPGLPRLILEILPGPLFASTDEQGRFSQLVPPGTYSVALAPTRYWNIPCMEEPHPVAVPEAGSIVSGINIPLTPEPNVWDVRVSIASGRARPGFPLDYTITYENVGTVTASGTITFDYDAGLIFSSATPMPDRHTPGTAEWDFSDLPVGAVRSMTMTMTVPASMPISTELCSQANLRERINRGEYLGSYQPDLRDEFCVYVNGSYDPNDIQVTPNGENGNGVLAEDDSVLTYLVRFQNTGTDTAFTVVVTDTLAAGHLAASIRLGAASHPYSFRLSGSGAMSWTFANILLPDSNVDERGSHGYLKYSVRLRKGLKPGAEIANRASIYFDFNEPVVTNTVVSVIPKRGANSTERSGEPIRPVYPNPARGSITVDAAVPAGSAIAVQNMLGQTLLRQTAGGGAGPITIDVSSLPAGAYTLVIPVGDGAYITEKISLVR